MLKWLYKLGCYASVVNPIQKYSLVLGCTLIISNVCYGLLNFILIYNNLKLSLFYYVLLYFSIFIILYFLINRNLTEDFLQGLSQKRYNISKSKNISYQFVLLFVLLFSVVCFFGGMILGSELN